MTEEMKARAEASGAGSDDNATSFQSGHDHYTPDLNEARRFLNRLDGAGRFGFRTFDDYKERKDQNLVGNWHGTFDAVQDALAEYNDHGAGVFFTVNELDGKGYKAENVTRVRAVFIDLDQGGDEGRAALARVLECELRPNLVYETSPGKFHCYWQVDGLPPERFTDVQSALARRFDGDPSIKDLPRVMRLPGFFHRKGKPFRSRIVSINNSPARYAGADILAAFLPGKPEIVEGASKFAARIPATILDGEGRERHLVSVAGSMRRRGADAEEIYAALAVMNQRRCVPPKDDAEVRRIAESIAKKPTASEGDFIKTTKGNIVADSQDNVRLALERLGAAVSHDQFADRLLIQRGDAPPQHLDDAVLDRLWLEIDSTFSFRPTQTFYRTVLVDHARNNGFHPVQDYLNSLIWDDTPRLDTWLIEYGGAADSEYCRAVGALVLIAAVRRVRRPGVKFDEMVVLESAQGTGKSSALAALCPNPDWFTDDLPLNVGAKEVIERTSGKWIVEAGELSGMRKSDVEHLKGFLSRQVDVARLAYARVPTERARHFVVIGTTNSDAYLKDSTGNRRFWPLRVSGFDLKGLKQDRDQIWAEAAAREAAGESIRLAPALWPQAAVQQERRRVEDPWENALQDVLRDLNGRFLADDVWTILNMHNIAQRDQRHNARIGEAMRKLGFERKRFRDGPRQERKYFYARGNEFEQQKRIVLEVDRDEAGRVFGMWANLEDADDHVGDLCLDRGEGS